MVIVRSQHDKGIARVEHRRPMDDDRPRPMPLAGVLSDQLDHEDASSLLADGGPYPVRSSPHAFRERRRSRSLIECAQAWLASFAKYLIETVPVASRPMVRAHVAAVR